MISSTAEFNNINRSLCIAPVYTNLKHVGREGERVAFPVQNKKAVKKFPLAATQGLDNVSFN
jgi:hypothetical protein